MVAQFLMLNGDEYLQQFYPNGGFNSGDFKKMADKMCITAEITIPLNSSSGKVIFLKVVDLSPTGIIDIMGSICALDSMKNIFKITGFLEKDYGDKGAKWRELTPSFLFANATYNHITGEIDRFGPDYINKYKPTEEESLFKTYLVSPPSSDQFFVRFFVDPSLREIAEKTIGHKLPDEFCKAKNNISSGNAIVNGTVMINTNFKNSGSLTAEQEEILKKPIQLTNVTYDAPQFGQSEIRKNNTIYGKNCQQSNLVLVPVPENYPLQGVNKGRELGRKVRGADGNIITSLYNGTKVTHILFHRLAAKRLEYALKDVINHYGPNIATIAPGICIWNNSYRESQSSAGCWSIHSYGLALDFDAGMNGLYTKAPKARLTQAIYKPFIEILRHHGLHSLGEWWGQDWMHFQAATFP